MGECRSIYLNACAEIAGAFADDGFRYLKSRQAMVKREADLTFTVGFQSAPRNWLVDRPIKDPWPVANSDIFPSIEELESESSVYGSVALSVMVLVRSKRMQEWRMSLPHPLSTFDLIAGCSLDNFVGDGRQYLFANLANPATRPGRIRAVSDLIRTAALPYFERFQDPQRVVAGLIEGSDPGLAHELAMEYASCHGGKENAMALLKRNLCDAPDYFLEGYRESLQEYRLNGIPQPNTCVCMPAGAQLAFAALALGLESME